MCIRDRDEELLAKDSGLQQMKRPSLDMLIGQVEITGLAVAEIRKGKKAFSMEGDLQLDSVTRDTVAGMHFVARRGEYAVPDMDETIGVRQLEIDSKKKFLRVDSIEIRPSLGREEIGRLKGHQVDVVRAAAEGLEVTGIDVMGLLQHRLYADPVSYTHLDVYKRQRLTGSPG